MNSPIGIFDSGYGGLTILDEIRKSLPQYDYLYLGDNARTPYGTRSFDVVYRYTWECVRTLFDMGCQLVVLACNTASAKALRSLQQVDLMAYDETRRVLGVIRPTVEALGGLSTNGHVGLLATQGTVQSESYPIEIKKLYEHILLSSEACPMWVPLIENNEHHSPAADYFVKKNLDNLLQKDPLIDTIMLGCTHYPLLLSKIENHLPSHIKIVSQGSIVAASLSDYLLRHPEMEQRISRNAQVDYCTTESIQRFSDSASIFLDQKVIARHIEV